MTPPDITPTKPIIKALALVAIGSLALMSTRARAQDAPYKLTAGTSLFEIRPGFSNPAVIAPGISIHGGRVFRLWTLEAAVFFNGLKAIGSSEDLGTELAFAALACWRNPGACIGPLVVLEGPHGGLFQKASGDRPGFTWGQSTGIVLSFNPDAYNFLQYFFGGSTPTPNAPIQLQRIPLSAIPDP